MRAGWALFWDSLAGVLTLSAFIWLSSVQMGQHKPLGKYGKESWMAQMNVSGYGNALSVALSEPILGLYTNNASAPLNVHAGLRQVYRFGLYKHCAYVNKTNGSCSGSTAGHRFQPYKIITNDMPSNYSNYTDSIFHNTTFANSLSLGRSSHAAYPLLLLGMIFSFLSAFLTMFEPISAAITAFIASVFVLIGATIWAVIVKQAAHINSLVLQPSQVPIGIHVSYGDGYYYTWAAFGSLVGSIFTQFVIIAYGGDDY